MDENQVVGNEALRDFLEEECLIAAGNILSTMKTKRSLSLRRQFEYANLVAQYVMLANNVCNPVEIEYDFAFPEVD